MQALHEGRDERVAGAEAVDDLHRVSWDVDLGSLVEQQDTALAPLEHERGDAETEQRLRVARGRFDFLLVADDHVGMPSRGLRELAVRIWLLPQRRAPIEIEDREVLMRLGRSEGRP